MARTDENNPDHWFRFAQADIDLVDLAIRNGMANSAVLAKLVEALEKFLKGYLIRCGWSLRRIHDIEALLQEAKKFDPSLDQHLKAIEPLTEAYFEGRYPGFDVDEITLDELRTIRAQAQSLIDQLRKSTN
ncbi:MAG: HEPN domain-containing protein [Verrucomicrobia bacterium]|nr:HEPN domain-containing protein [Verrucomicrobiota bacterium]